MFHYDVEVPRDDGEDFPGLVDVLSVVDMALDRRENLARRYDQDRLLELRDALEYAIFRALQHSLSYRTRDVGCRVRSTGSGPR